MSQTLTAIEESFARPLTTLSEDEQMFRRSVREFAEGEIRKRVEEMDEQGHLDPALMKQCFELGLMGIETPEEYGGASGSFFQAILAVEELSRVDASVGVFVDVQNIYYTAKQAYGRHFDYNRFWKAATRDRTVVKATAYAIDRGDEKQRQFQNILRGIGGNPKQFQCYGNPPRQTEDPSSPPCVPFFQGDNFGATYQGITKNEIKVLVYMDIAGYGASTGLETSLDVEFRVEIVRKTIAWPRIETDAYVMVLGSGRPLLEALQHATSDMQRWLVTDYGLTERGASIFMGQALEYEVANVVDPNFTVVAKVRKAQMPRR